MNGVAVTVEHDGETVEISRRLDRAEAQEDVVSALVDELAEAAVRAARALGAARVSDLVAAVCARVGNGGAGVADAGEAGTHRSAA